MLPFDLPPPAGYSVSPKWDGRNFVFGDQSTPVLEYNENFAGWSDDLTALHEEAAGDSHPIDLASRNDALAQVKKFMPFAEAVIMEIGCSSGFLIRDLAKSFPEAVIIGSDVVKEPLYRLARNLLGIPLIRFDLLQCPLPDQSVDVLVMLNVLEHIEDDRGAIQKAFNLLKPGGYLIIEVPAGPSLYDAYDAELQHFRRYAASELEGKLNEAGFKVCRRSHLGFVLFPAFVAVKLLNKCFYRKENRAVVRNQAVNTSASALVRLAMYFESKYLSHLSLPFGVRILAVAKKENRDG
jgi:SAM-dependent methyltransferase